MIVITSFKESLTLAKLSAYRRAKFYSVSRFQPKGFHYISLPFFAAIDKHGNKLTMRGKDNPIESYINDLYEYYDTVRDDINEWIDDLNPHDIDVLCCWCPHASHSKEQMRIYNTFICHTGLVAREIEKRRYDIKIFMDYDHSAYLDERFKPNHYRTLKT